MSIPNEALRKILMEIEAKSIQSSQQITVVKQQLAAKNRENRILQLTSAEVSGLPEQVRLYEGVGKMFIQTQPKAVNERLASESAELKSEAGGLEKKLHYLETTYKNSRENFEQILKRAGGA